MTMMRDKCTLSRSGRMKDEDEARLHQSRRAVATALTNSACRTTLERRGQGGSHRSISGRALRRAGRQQEQERGVGCQ